MNHLRVNCLFSEKEFDGTRVLYRTILNAACKEASRKASLYTFYKDSLTHYHSAFSLSNLLRHMPVAQTGIPDKLKYEYDIEDVLEALQWLNDAGYLWVEPGYRTIQLETHLFKMIAEAWAESMGVDRWNSFFFEKPIHAISFERASEIEAARMGLEARGNAREIARKEVVAA